MLDTHYPVMSMANERVRRRAKGKGQEGGPMRGLGGGLKERDRREGQRERWVGGGWG